MQEQQAIEQHFVQVAADQRHATEQHYANVIPYGLGASSNPVLCMGAIVLPSEPDDDEETEDDMEEDAVEAAKTNAEERGDVVIVRKTTKRYKMVSRTSCR